MMSIRTDLAMEAKQANGEIEGVSMTQKNIGAARVTHIQVLSEIGAQKLGKPIGRYITIEQDDLHLGQPLDQKALVCCIAEQIRELIGGDQNDRKALVVGLGNRALTPDALGPRVAGYVLVTRHMLKEMPQILKGRLRSVCACAPGVAGTTGLETKEVIKSIVNTVQPDCVIVVDSLAARSTSRILNTVQITNAGIVPGSGVGNHRSALTEQELGIPVIAIGVPMVVHASTILRDALEKIVGEELHLEKLLKETNTESFVVTPVMIDEAVNTISKLLSQAINIALQPDLTEEELTALSI